MKKPSKIEEAYSSLERLSRGQMNSEAASEIKKALTGSISLLVSKAADIVGDKSLRKLIPELIAAFHRFMADKGRADKQCLAKISIVNALNKLEYQGSDVYIAGARHVQMEPAYGEMIDAACDLRCGCAFGLARIHHPDTNYILVDLLVDKETPVRVAAVKALAYIAEPESELLLRLKVLNGDAEVDVMSECFAGLMVMVPERSLEFVSRYLKTDDLTIVESAALAVGESHIPEAFNILRDCWDEDPYPPYRRALLLPIALVRSDESFKFLVEVVKESSIQTASQALSALTLYASGRTIDTIREAVKTRNDSDLSRQFECEFGTD